MPTNNVFCQIQVTNFQLVWKQKRHSQCLFGFFFVLVFISETMAG